jgi:hypothetical protein
MRTHSLLSLLAFGSAVYGCSLINSPDDVLPEGAAGSGATGATGATSGDGGTDSEGGEPTAGGTTGSGAAGGEDPGMGGQVGAGGADIEDPGPGPDPTTGLIVLGAQDADMERHLLVRSARTGAEIRRDALPVAAVAYDEAPGRHVWFVFTSGAYPAAPTGVADLEVRRFDDASGKWAVLSKTTALPPPVPDQLLVLNDRLVYLSHQVDSGTAVSAVTLLDTSDLSDVSELVTQPASAGQEFVGLVGDRGSEVDAEAPGGRMRLMVAQDCTADCELSAHQVFVADDFTQGTSLSIDRFVGQPRFAKGRTTNRLYAALRSTTPSDRLVVRSYLGADLTNPTAFALTGFVGTDVGGFALAECAEAGVVSDVDGAQLFAFNLTSGMQQVVDLTAPGALVYSEPFAPSAIVLDPTSAPGLRAFEISKSGVSNVAANERSIFRPAGDLTPLTGDLRRSEMAACP